MEKRSTEEEAKAITKARSLPAVPMAGLPAGNSAGFESSKEEGLGVFS
jgi:hypothetical protein